jgi:hypothetical protein
MKARNSFFKNRRVTLGDPKLILTIVCAGMGFKGCVLGSWAMTQGEWFLGPLCVIFGIMFAATPLIHE